MAAEEELIVVTGFGPFREYLVNPSWEAAKVYEHYLSPHIIQDCREPYCQLYTLYREGLRRTGLGHGTEIHITEIPVCYSKAQQTLAEIWEQMKPKLAVHLGIARGTKCIVLEQTAKNQSYKDRDVCGLYPANNCCIEGGEKQLDSIIDMKSLAKHLKGLGLDVIYSRDAGRYLCDFVYYCSLHYGKRRAVLIHIPASGSLASSERLVPELQAIIQALLHQLNSNSICTKTQVKMKTEAED